VLALVATGVMLLGLVLRSVAPPPSLSGGRSHPGGLTASPRPVPLVGGAAARRHRVPILMYHVVGRMPAAASFPELFVRPADFARQMAALSSHGYRAITLRSAYEAWTRGRPIPRRAVVVSFDDGYRGIYTNAFPVMRRLGWPGTLNLKLDALHEAGGLTPSMVREVIRAGWEVDSHTITHADLTTLDATALRHEVIGSRRRLQRELGVPADFFCYPSGRYDRSTVQLVRRAGYLGATTVTPGYADPSRMYELPRVRVDRDDRVRGLLAELGQR
jgi:peptidoglycan/xylan/chitin deacetylase (PgdA/CDA1 family)